MLSNPSQYSPQSLIPQFPGLQAAGLPQMTPALFGQPGAYNGNAHFGNAQLGPESGHAGFSQPFPLGGQSGQIGGQANPFLQNSFPQNPSAQNPFTANPFAPNPHLQSQWQSPLGSNPFMSSFGQAGGHIPAHQIVPVLGQLAQQIAIQSAVAQQIGIAVHQLAHQLASQGLQGAGYLQGGQGYLQGGQGYAQGGYGGLGPQGQGYTQGGYGGPGPQAQGWGQPWGANRPQTIQ
jgi:hypothetical protein